MLRAKRPFDHSGSTKHRSSFWRSAHSNSAVSQAPEPEPVKPKPIQKPTASLSVSGVIRNQQPPATTSSSNMTYRQQNLVSGSYSVIKGNPISQTMQDARNAVSTTGPAPAPENNTSTYTHAPSTSSSARSHSIHPSKPDASVSHSVPLHAHRVSVQSLNSSNTASTSRSSFERISTENFPHSWGSTVPSSAVPHSTDSLVRIPASEVTSTTASTATVTGANGSARRFPLVESEALRKSHGDTQMQTQGEQASDALPLPNSEYESPVKVPGLRRSKPYINLASASVRDATPTTGRQSPVPITVADASLSRPQEHPRHQHSKSDMIEVAYVRQQHIDDGKRGETYSRNPMLTRIKTASSSSKPSSTASRPMPTHTPRVPSNPQPVHPNMTKLKQTSIPRISTSGISTGSPMIEQRPDSLASPRKVSADSGSALASWMSLKSPTMTSAPTYETLTSVVMSPSVSAVTSPRTLVSSSHHTDVAPIQPSQLRQYSQPATTIAPTAGIGGTPRSPIVESDYDSPSTVAPNTPTSHTVRNLFSSLTSRSHRNSTPHPLRFSQSNPPITAQEVDSPRVTPGHILTPPPLPPQSTRPDAPQQSFTHHHSQSLSHSQSQAQGLPPYSAVSPRHASVDMRPSSSRPAAESRQDSGLGLRSPSPNSILRSFGPASSSGAQPSTSSPAQKTLAGKSFHSPRTLMSDSEVTTVTTVSVTRSTVVMPAGQPVAYTHPIERRNSASTSTSKKEGSVVSSSRHPTSPSPAPQAQSQATGGGLFSMFRPKSPRHPFSLGDRSSSPAPPPLPSKTPPPRSQTASPSRKFAFSIPINLRHKPKKSISGASVEAVIGGERANIGEAAMSSQGSLLPTRTPDPHYSELMASGNARRQQSILGVETDTDVDGGDDDGETDEAMKLKMMAVEAWKSHTEGAFAMSGKRRSRPGVSFELPASESERDDTAMTAVSVAPGGGRPLRRARAHARQHLQFSDNESAVY